MNFTPADSSACCNLSIVDCFASAPFSTRVTVLAVTPAFLASSRTPQPTAARASTLVRCEYRSGRLGYPAPTVRRMGATLDGRVAAIGAVFEDKFMLPWSFSEETAAEKYLARRIACGSWLPGQRSYRLAAVSTLTRVIPVGPRRRPARKFGG
jgi:hypothetical protein